MEATGDPAVDAVVARAADTDALPTADHNGLYTTLMDQLQGELDADPAADIAGGADSADSASGGMA